MFLSRRVFTLTSLKSTRNYQVTVLGAANEIGQTVSLLLRGQPSITKLIIHDTLDITPGVLMDVAHVPAESSVMGYKGEETLDRALKGSDLVIATGGMIRKPGITEESWLQENTYFIKNIAPKISKCEPLPFLGIVTEPVNSMVPMAAEIMRNHGNFDGKKLFGITAIDALRAQCLYAAENNLSPCECFVPVIGGHSDKTIVPLLSQAIPRINMNDQLIQEFTLRIRKCEDIVSKAKKGWSPTLSISYSVLVFVRGILEALEGNPSRVNAYIENNDFGTSYFSGLVSVNQNGVGEMQRYTDLSKYEVNLLERTIEQLRKDITKGKKILELA
ncbi:putative mitochondrial malate dehydrogenase isoform 1 [Operophtera brumata]|uniref:Malate dehydrogenase, mitochondrial n=1 Tax=Operophtera brumata TaxID=104452 RepID=A0A0L7LSP5_OPEBR|nr:putative mitochondrial malate dehydrogenase isoform 1 [Operophtera brumata]